MSDTKQPVWFIADATTGLAAALAEAVLASGQHAVLAARLPSQLQALVARHPEQALALALDATDTAAVDMAIAAAERRFGRIDVLATSAAQRYPGAIEEGEEGAMRALFDENVFGPINLARRVLPAMRARRAGHVVMLTCASVQAPAFEGFGHAARSALEALAEALFYEVEPLGIGVTLVDPGSGDDAGASAPRAAGIADYDGLAGRAARASAAVPVDAARAAQAIMQAVAAGRGPLRLVLGRAALQRAYDRLRVLKVGFDAWADLAASADVPAPGRAVHPPPSHGGRPRRGVRSRA
ncbi:SDR family NAD(P)-dependent oxidoreductase [Massilia luteola]|uniref:SDR family NAD(P)-dependent oxidoreductase n=1 Tax=Massilia luteola TaxID=3081751 RepID=UPI002ACBDB32|nr:SDR family NAD(P)-dependent oxidoreductase [Massilia sp. Gc5]